MDLPSCFVLLGSPPIHQQPSVGKKRKKAKEKVKADSKELEEYSLVKNKHRIFNGGQKRTLLGGQRKER